MSALTEKVAAEHDYFDTPKGRQCRCGARPPRGVEMLAWHREHIAEVTEAAVHAQVLADLKIAALHVLTNASNYPEPVVPHILGQDVESLANKIVEQVIEHAIALRENQERT